MIGKRELFDMVARRQSQEDRSDKACRARSGEGESPWYSRARMSSFARSTKQQMLKKLAQDVVAPRHQKDTSFLWKSQLTVERRQLALPLSSAVHAGTLRQDPPGGLM